MREGGWGGAYPAPPVTRICLARSHMINTGSKQKTYCRAVVGAVVAQRGSNKWKLNPNMVGVETPRSFGVPGSWDPLRFS